MRIAMISEHASPLATIGGVDSGGQNVYVAQVARELARLGHEVDVFTRRDDAALPTVVQVAPRWRVIHVDAGPPAFVPKEQLLGHMAAFAAFCDAWLRTGPGYDVVHANFFMSGQVGLALKRKFGLPLVTTSIGAEGLPGLADIVTVADEPAAIAAALVRLLRDDDAWLAASRAQSVYAAEHFGYERMRDTLLDALADAARVREARQAEPPRDPG